jgi:hypothetical protein
MLDWWTVPGERWGVLNLDFKVEVREQERARPHRLPEYTEADVAAFEGGNWRFVMVWLIPVDRDLVDLVNARRLLVGVEWGELPGGRIDRPDVTDEQALELARQAVRILRKQGVTVETDQDSELSERALTAPF